MADTVRILVEMEGQQLVNRKLAGIAARAADISPAADAVFDAIRTIVDQQFGTEGGSGDSGPWPRLAKSTQRERRLQGFGAAHPILQRHGRLIRSVTEITEDSLLVVTPTRLAFGTYVPYAKYHQSILPRTKLPRRPIISLTGDQRHTIVRPLRRHITGNDPNAPVRDDPTTRSLR